MLTFKERQTTLPRRGVPSPYRRAIVLKLVLALVFVIDQQRVAAAPTCRGDCNATGQVTAADIVRMSAIAVGNTDLSNCALADSDGDERITDADIADAIHNMFGGCAQQASYDALAGDMYHLAYPSRLVNVTQAAAIVAGLDDVGAKGEEELRAVLAQLLSEYGVPVDELGQITIYALRQDAGSCEDCLATCTGRCVQSPRGDCFCYERLPTDPPGRLSITILLLERAEDESIALAADRVPCFPALLQAGVNDNFSNANGAEAPSPGPGLLTLLQQAPNQPPAAFDGLAKDRVFGHTFTLPQGKCLKDAKLLFRARPLSNSPMPASNNDVLHLGFVSPAGQFVGAHWVAFFGTGNTSLPILLGQPWLPGNYPAPAGASFALNLGSLPGGMNLLPDLDAKRSLDVYIQDDTSVDYLSLVVRICDCPIPTPTPTGTATRTATFTRTLTPSRTPTVTATKTFTPRPTPTLTSTATPRPTVTRTSTTTRTPVATATRTPVATATATAPTATATVTPTVTRTPMCVAPPPNMVAWWPMDEVSGATLLVDIIGGSDATPKNSPIGGVQAPQPVAGTVGGAIEFPKFGNSLTGAYAPPQSALLFVGSADFTIDAWVKFPPAAPNVPHYVVNRVDTTSNVGYALYIVSPTVAGNEQLVLQWADGTNAGTAQTSVPISANQWHHVAATFARNVGGNALDIRLYVDGAQGGQQLANPPGLGSLVTLLFLEIGDQPSVSDAAIALDELEIFDRALAAPEIQGLFAAGSAGKCRPPTPTATVSATPTPSLTATRSATRTLSPTASFTRTSTATATLTRTATPTATRSATATITVTVTPSPTGTTTRTATPVVTPTCITPPALASMVAWWPLDEPAGANTVVDIGLSPANNGVPQPGPIGASPPGGPLSVAGNLVATPPDTALFFYQPTTFVQVPSSPDLDLAGSDLTVDAWVKPLPGPWSAGRDIFHVYTVIDKLNLTTNTGYAFYVEVQSSCPTCPPAGQQPPPSGVTSTTTMGLVFAVGNGATITFHSSPIPFYSGSGKIFPFPTPPSVLVPQPPPWKHVAVAVDRAANALAFYGDGLQLGAAVTPVAAGANNTDPLWIGGTRLYGTAHAPQFTEFTLNEIEVFNVPLSQPQVLAIAAAGAGKCKNISTPTATVTRTATNTRPPSPTATSTRTPTATTSRTPTVTSSLTRTATATRTPIATATSTRTSSATPTTTPPCITPPSDMVAWWTADNTANDLSGNGNHGTLHGAASYTAGMVGAAFSLPTIADYVDAPDSPSLNFVGNFSIDAWINTTNSITGRATIVDKRGGSNTNPIGYHLFIFQGLLGFQLADGQPFLNNVSSGPLINDGSWHQVAATIDRSSATGGKLYVDGQLIFTFDPTTRPGSIVNTAPLRLGVRLSGAQTFENFQGAIDEVELFDRALGSQEVQAVFAARAGGKCKTPLATRTATGTATRTGTRTATATRTASSTPTPRATSTSTSTVTATFTRTASATATRTATATATRTSSATPTTTSPCITPPADMVAWWTADNTANDLSGNGNHGTLHGAASYTAGMVGAAFSLPTIADYVDAPDSPSLNFVGNFSIDAWINTTNSITGRATIVDKRGGSNTNPIGYHLFIFQGLLGFQLADGQPFLNNVSSGPLINDGSWHQVAATIDRSSATGGKLYVDGQLIFTFDPTTRPGSIVNTAPLRLGVRLSGAQTFENFQGAIDEVELFDRALGSQEVQAVFAARAGGKCKTPLATRTATGTATRTATPTTTATRTASSTPTPRATNTSTFTVTASFTRTASATTTSTRTATATSTASLTPTPRATNTLTPTVTASFTRTASATVTSTRTASVTRTPTHTPTITSTRTASFTATATSTRTETRTPTPSSTASSTPIPSPTCPGGMCSPTPTRTPSVTPTTCIGEICASKFLDRDQDGVHDPGEPDIAGWLINIADSGSNVIATLTTGAVQCTGVPGMATYTVSEVLQSGWTQTFPSPPGTHHVFVECGQLLNLEFGNFENAASTPTATSTATPTRTRTKTPNILPND